MKFLKKLLLCTAVFLATAALICFTPGGNQKPVDPDPKLVFYLTIDEVNIVLESLRHSNLPGNVTAPLHDSIFVSSQRQIFDIQKRLQETRKVADSINAANKKPEPKK